MAEVMQKAQRPLSVAERSARAIEGYKKETKEDDQKLATFLEICLKEQDERDKNDELYKLMWCFGMHVSRQAHYAIEQCGWIPAGKYPKSRKLLATVIADGLLGTKDEKDRAIFASFLCRWPAKDGKIPADAIREIAEFRWRSSGTYEDNIRPVFETFFRAESKNAGEANDDVVRMVFKLVGNWADVHDISALGQCMAMLHGRARRPLLDLIQHAVAE